MHFGPLAVGLLIASLLAGCATGPATGSTSSGATPPSSVVHPALAEGMEVTTTQGTFVAALYPEAAPKTVELMRQFAATDYYVGRGFTRIVPGHVIQVADAANGATDSPLRVPLEANASFHFSAGALGIARDVDPGSGGPEFFVMDFATSHLDGNYTVFGQVVSGLDVVHAIARGPAIAAAQLGPAAGYAPTDRLAVQPATITAVRIVPLHAGPALTGALPLQVARNVRSGEFRHSLEWPADLAVGRAAQLTWYVRPYNATAAPDAKQVRLQLDGVDVAVAGEPTAGIYHATWTPRAHGPAAAHLVGPGIDVVLRVTVA